MVLEEGNIMYYSGEFYFFLLTAQNVIAAVPESMLTDVDIEWQLPSLLVTVTLYVFPQGKSGILQLLTVSLLQVS